MGELLETHAEQLLLGISEHAAKGGIDLDKPAVEPVDAETERSVFKDAAESYFAVPQFSLGSQTLSDIPKDRRCAYGLAGSVADRRNRDRDGNPTAVLFQPDGFESGDVLARPDFFDIVAGMLADIGR